MTKYIFLLLTLLVVIHPSAFCIDEGKQTFDQLEKTALEELKLTNTPGAVVAVIRDERVIFLKAFGVSNVGSRTPVTPDMLFRIGSATKMFTAAALLTLFAKEGRSLNEPLGRYIKGLSPKLSQITADQLLSHQAGINAELVWDGPHDESLFSPTLKARVDDFFIAKPGEAFSYSNLGYAFAGLVIQEVSGKSYADSMSELLFRPLGMDRTTFLPQLVMTYPFSQGHNLDGRAGGPVIIRPVVDNVIYRPAGYLWSNADDLARFVIALLNEGKLKGKQLLPPSMVRQLSIPRAEISDLITEGSTWKYGYGLTIHNLRGVKIVEHAGDSPGFGALIRMVPEERFAVITLTNLSGVALNRTAERAMELVLPLKAKTETNPQISLPVSESEVAEMIGVYVNADYKAEIFSKEGLPFLRAFGVELRITKTGRDRFSTVPPNSSESENLILRRSKEGKIIQLQYALRIFKRE